MNIVVLCGGTSTERDVSISSATLVCKSLEERGHKCILLDVYLGISNEVLQSVESPFELGTKGFAVDTNVKDTAPDIQSIKNMKKDASMFFGENVLDICKMADIVFMGLHGENGENGKVQATFELFGIKYTGTGYEGSMLAMNKDLTRKILKSSGVLMAEGITVTKEDDILNMNLFVPAVVKPASGGSSVGVTIVENMEDLKRAIVEALKYDDKVVIEEYIKGREFSVGVIDKKALPIIEIIPKEGFYDYKNKYQAGMTEEICPAKLTEEERDEMWKAAEKVYEVLGLRVYSRIDFILSDANNMPYCLEANTLPGMTPTSLLPQEAKACGIDYGDLCEKIIELSLRG